MALHAYRFEVPPRTSEYQSQGGCLLRHIWMAAGNLALVSTAAWINLSAGWSIADILFGVIPLLMIGSRYLDIVRHQGTTIDGDEPATMADLKRYALILLIVALTLWTAARGLGPGFSVGS